MPCFSTLKVIFGETKEDIRVLYTQCILTHIKLCL